jgi:hypothetical protein
MKALKGVVIGMGVLILLGLGVVVAAIISRVNDGGEPRARAEVTLDLPSACGVGGMTAVDGRLAVRVAGPAGADCPAMVLIDPDTGQVRTTIRVGAGPGAASGATGGADGG